MPWRLSPTSWRLTTPRSPSSSRTGLRALGNGIPSEPFTAIGHVCHVQDIELDGYQVRIDRVVREFEPALPSLDGMALAVERDYANSDATVALETFRRARAQTLECIRGLSPEQFGRRGIFEGYGPVTVSALVNFPCSHDQQHLAGLQWLMGKIASLGGDPGVQR